MESEEIDKFVSELEKLLEKYGVKLSGSTEGDVDLLDAQTARMIGWWTGEVNADNFQNPSR